MFVIQRTVLAVIIGAVAWLSFYTAPAIAARVTTDPYFIYGSGGAGEAPSLGEWISQKNQYYQAAFDSCIASYNAAGGNWPEYGAKACERYEVVGTYNYPNASTYNGVQTPQGITVTKTKNGVVSSTNNYISVVPRCPGGYSGPIVNSNNNYECVKDEPQSCEADGDPINILTGEKFENEIDYSSADGILKLERIYQDQYSGWHMNSTEHLFYLAQSNTPICLAPIAHEFSQYTFQNPENINETQKYIYYSCAVNKNSGSAYIKSGRLKHHFQQAGGVFVGQGRFGLKLKLEKVDPLLNQGIGWVFSNAGGDKSYFSADGYLQRKVFLNGAELIYQYIGSKLSSVTDNNGRSLIYTYDSSDRLVQVLLPDNNTVSYEYGTDEKTIDYRLLKKVVWSNGESVTYLYNEAAYKDSRSTSKFLLTGKLDSLGQRIDVTKYRSNKAIYNEIALGLQPRTFSIGSTNASVKDGLGSIRTYNYVNSTNGLLASTNQPAGSGCAAATESATYYANGLKKSEANFNGHKTQFNYDMIRALETVRVEGIAKTDSADYLPQSAVLAAGAKKITTQWHAQHRKPIKKAEPKLVTTFIYNGDADPFNSNQVANCSPLALPLLCRKVQQATIDANGAAGLNAVLDSATPKREEFYTYNNRGQQLIYSRTGVGAPDEVREYYETTTSDWTKGDLKSITNASGHKTDFIRYDANGRLLAMQDANGIETLFTYDVRGRVTSQSIAGAITTHAYDLNGNRITSVLPNGVTVNYEYDAARRLTAVVNALGDKINYEYDVENNLRFERITTAGGVNLYTKQHVYDALSRVKNTLSSSGQGSTYLYDANGNLTGKVDAKTQTTGKTFDPLDRLTRTTDALTGKTDYSYDAQGNLTQVKDPKNNTTIYGYNAFGDLVSQTSPDTGTTTFTYDAIGNRTSSTDARGVVVNYSYDALDRLTSIQYPAVSAENITYGYDATANGNYGIGRLTSIDTSATALDFEYNSRGLITKKYTQVGNAFASTQYNYDAVGNLTGIIYPSGREVNYQLNSLGRISGITTKANANAVAQTLISNVTYLPFGPAQSYSYGNGLSHTQTYDQDYRITAIQVGGILNRSYGYDLVNNITSINNSLNTANNQTFSYDALNRLITAAGGYGNLGYSYDAVGNRLTEVRNSVTDAYTYQTTSNRLTGIARAAGDRTFAYDAAGNPTQRTADDNSNQTFTFNNANRLSSVNVNSNLAATYSYNPLGQRVVKTLPNSSKEIYHYDEAGQLIAITDGAGVTLREYIYWGMQQVALVNNGTLYFIHSDHLNTPQVVTDSNQQVVWMGDYEPFGKLAQNQTNSIELYSRFPGQYLDGETGLYYNYFRDYDPSIGRYIESDPIGLEGGINTYAYVEGNPLSYIDPDGLQIAVPVPMPMVRPIPGVRPGTLVDPFVIPNDPNQNGQSEKCKRIKEKIENINKEIYEKRIPDLEANPGNLPRRIGPGENLRDTIRGHEKLLNRQMRRLEELKRQYEKECMCMPV